MLDQQIQAVDDLETLLLLSRDRRRSWTAVAVSRELGVPLEAAANALDRLCSANLLDVRIGQELVFRYSPGTPELDRLVERLSSFYSAQRLAVSQYLARRAIGRARAAAIRTFGQGSFGRTLRTQKREGKEEG